MSVNSYIQLVNTIDDFAENHMQIQRFKAEFTEQLPNFATQSEAYPILYMSPIGTQFLSNVDTFDVRFYAFDIIQKDRENINTILSDTNLILNDLKKWFTEGDNFIFDIVGDPSATPLNNALLDYAAGWQMDVRFNVPSYCVDEIPFSGSPQIPVDGIDVIYTRYLTCETVTGCTTFQEYIADAIAGITGNTGSDTYVTGGTYNQSNGIATFTNNTGGTFNVSGFTLPMTDVFVTGGTYDSNSGVATFTNTTGGTFTVNGFFTGSTGDSLWEVGSAGNFSLKAINDSTLDATGDYATASGFRTLASGSNSFAANDKTNAVGHASFAEGHQTTATGDYSHSEGWLTIASGEGSHAEGQETRATDRTAHAEGLLTTASNRESHAEGALTTASGEASHAEGAGTIASGYVSHAEGNTTVASAFYSHAEGYQTIASGQTAHAEGASTIAGGIYSHSEGYLTIASGSTSHAEGNTTTAGGTASHSQNWGTKAMGQYSHAGGFQSTASGNTSFVHGNNSLATGASTIVLGNSITGTSDNTVYVPNIQFDLNAPSDMAVGRMEWNSTDGTADLRMAGNSVTQRIGEQTMIRATNQTASGMTKGQVVRIVGATGGFTGIQLAQGNNELNSSTTIGILLEDIAVNTQGFVGIQGMVHGLNTNSFTEGDILYLSTTVAGGITNVAPTAPNHTVVVGYVAKKSATDGHILLHVQNGYELNELHNVNISGTPSNGQILQFSSTLSAWTNTTVSLPVVYKSTTDSAVSSGVTGVRLMKSQLIPAGTFQTGDVITIKSRITKTNNNAVYGNLLYVNTASTITGAVVLATYNTSAITTRFTQIKRDFVIKSATQTESFFVTTTSLTDENGAVQTPSLTNINWAIDQYIIFAVNSTSAADTFVHNYYIIEKL